MLALRVLMVVGVGAVLTAFTLKEPQYAIEIPDGWQVEPKDKESIITVKPVNDPDGTNCNVYYVDRAAIKGPQSALNAAYTQPISVEGWNDFLSTKPEDTKISERVSVDIGGKFLQIATVDIPAKDVRARIGFIITPGRAYDAGCYARSGRFEEYRARFEKMVRSLRPE